MLETLPHFLLLLSLLALLVGPILFYMTGVSRGLWQGIDAFVLVGVAGIVFFHILPDSFEKLGWPALVIALMSFYLPALLEKITAPVARTAHSVTLVLALIGIVLHAFTDGIALIAPELSAEHETALPLAIILHRIPDGITIWWLLRPEHGKKMAIRTLIIIAVATVLGFYFGQNLSQHLPVEWFGLFEALLGGALLHVIFHTTLQQESAEKTPWQWSEGFGALLAIAGLWLFPLADMHLGHGGQFSKNFFDLARQSAPALLLAYTLSGILELYLKQAPVNWLSRGTQLSQAFKGMALGLPLPLCSCGVIPVYRSLVLKGVPLAAALSFLIATPELSLDALLLSLPLLGGQMTLIRLAFAAVVALIVGYCVSRIFPQAMPKTSPAKENPAPIPSSLIDKIKSVLKHGFAEAFDDTIPWILVGIAIAALLAPTLQGSEFFQKIPDTLEVPLFALLGLPLYVCASGATPLVAVLMLGGVSPGAALAFLLTGPATNATTYGVLTQLHGHKIALSFMSVMFLTTVFLGIGINFIFPQITPPEWHHHEHGTWLVLQQISLWLLTLTLLISLLRNGPRRLLENILRFDAELETHEKSHGHDCCQHE